MRRRTRHDEDGALVGVLYEADFEKSSARLRIPLGSSVTVRFEDDHAHAVKEALRESVRLRGRITHNVATSAIVSVELADIAQAEQLMMPSIGDFWATGSSTKMAQAQGVCVVESIEALQDDTISDDDADSFMAALGL